MGAHTIIAAAMPSSRSSNQTQQYPQEPHWPSTIPHIRQIDEQRRIHERQTGYGATGSSSSSPLKGSPKGKEPDEGRFDDIEEGEEEEVEGEYDEVLFEPVIDGEP